MCEPQPAWTARFLGLGLGYSPTVCVLPPLLFYSLSFHFPAKLSTGPLLKHMRSSLSVAPYMSLHPLSCVRLPRRFACTLSSLVSSCCMYLPTKWHCLDFPCASLAQHVPNHLPPQKSVLPSVSSISVNDTTISPAAQARNQGAPSSLSFLSIPHRFSQVGNQISYAGMAPVLSSPTVDPA